MNKIAQVQKVMAERSLIRVEIEEFSRPLLDRYREYTYEETKEIVDWYMVINLFFEGCYQVTFDSIRNEEMIELEKFLRNLDLPT